MGKNTDKLYITHSEWQNGFGGTTEEKKRFSTKGKYKKMPFDACCLSLQPFKNPVCSPDGHIFDLENIQKWLKEHRNKNPITGNTLEPSELISLHFSKNNHGEYHCPVTFRIFNEHVHIVAIKTTGNVFSYDAIDQLNIKAKHFKDLLNNQPFKKSDILTLQDPSKPELMDISQFYHVKHDPNNADIPGSNSTSSKIISRDLNIAGNTMASRILSQFDTVKDSISALPGVKFKDVAPLHQMTNFGEKRPFNAAHFSKGRVAASLTSTSISPITINEPALIDVNEAMFKQIKKRGYAQILTNLGQIGVELYCESAPRACFNFIALAKTGYYNDVIFHRNIKNFMIQGGDPTGTGTGGQSIWGGNFPDEFKQQLSHNARGILSMANKGKNTNTSQFFITYRPCKHLDSKHTIFGKVIGGEKVLDLMESVPVNDSDRPVSDIKMSEVVILVDPFEDFKNEIEKKKTDKEKKEEHHKMEEKLEQIPADSSIGKYLSSATVKKDSTRQVSMAPVQPPKKKVKKSNDFDFSTW